MTECNICCDKYTAVARKKITCPYCNFECCKSCVEQFLLNTATTEPRCMNNDCKMMWSMDFLSTHFNQRFYNTTYRNHTRDVFFDLEKAKLPSTQPYVEFELQTRRLCQEKKKAQEKLLKMQQTIEDMQNHVQALNNAIIRRRNNEIDLKNPDSSQFKMACPQQECNGFLNRNYKCSVCQTQVCRHCHAIKSSTEADEHVCKEADIETVKFLKKDTKNCPGCGINIHKIDGCDQMWCVECKTAFSWRTGRIERGVIHNPHFYEYQRQQADGGEIPRNPGDEAGGGCGGDVYYRTLHHHLREQNCKKKGIIEEFHRLATDIRHQQIAPAQTSLEQFDTRMRNCRVSYTLKELTDDMWKSSIKRELKQKERDEDLINIYTTFVNVCLDTFHRMLASKNGSEIDKMTDELFNILFYTNDTLVKNEKRFKRTNSKFIAGIYNPKHNPSDPPARRALRMLTLCWCQLNRNKEQLKTHTRIRLWTTTGHHWQCYPVHL